MQDATHGNSWHIELMARLVNVKLLEEFGKEKMSGHMGHETKTIQNLELMGADVQNNLLFVKGAVPGFMLNAEDYPAVKQNEIRLTKYRK